MKRRLFRLSELFKIDRKKLTWLDEFNVLHIFLIWVSIIVLFGFVYFFFSSSQTNLYSTVHNSQVLNLWEAIYFSFITATATGFGDIVPRGLFAVFAIIEVTFGLLLLAFVTSKIVSIKQNLILGEIYEISFSEKIHRLRSSLLLFRQNLTRIISAIHDGTLTKSEISDIFIYISSLETVLLEIHGLVKNGEKHSFSIKMDPIDTELLLSRVMQSFVKLSDLLELLKLYKVDWQRKETTSLIEKCLEHNERIFKTLLANAKLKDIAEEELVRDNDEVVKRIKSLLPKNP